MRASIERRSLLVATLLTPALAVSGCTTTPTEGDAETFVAERSRQWTACFSTGRTDVMEQILADDFVNTSPSGKRSDKKASIEAARQGPNIFASTRLDRIEIRVFGTTVLAFGEDLLTFKSAGAQPVRTTWTDTWLFRGRRWQVVASHESVLKDSA
jgi:hypothetical protein